MSPTTYLGNIRLDRARADIVAGDLTISAAAVRWGFTHFGRFARLYRDRFGELPSATRRTRHGASAERPTL